MIQLIKCHLNYVNVSERIQLGQDQQYWNMLGISVLDYFDLYKKFTYVRQESYKLNYIAKGRIR